MLRDKKVVGVFVRFSCAFIKMFVTHPNSMWALVHFQPVHRNHAEYFSETMAVQPGLGQPRSAPER
jgi:hypothetical protein